MSLEDLINKTMSKWMKGTGPENDIVLGSRVRLARNLEDIPFPPLEKREARQVVIDRTKEVMAEPGDTLSDFEWIELSDIPPLERHVLVEKHLISPALIKNVAQKAVLLKNDESASVMVNEEDHFRIQSIISGFSLMDAWNLASEVDDALNKQMHFAFDENLGYLTACPTNVGTGMRASIMMHLPALSMTNQIKKVIGAVTRFGLTVRGIYGEGTEVLGNIYQLSNEVTIGHTEEEIIKHLENVTKQVIDQERSARETIVNQGKLALEDRIGRSYGVLTHARMMTSQEAMQRLSDVRLGIDLDMIKGLEPRILQQLMVMIRPAHLQKIMGAELDPQTRDEKRADLLRERLKPRP